MSTRYQESSSYDIVDADGKGTEEWVPESGGSFKKVALAAKDAIIETLPYCDEWEDGTTIIKVRVRTREWRY